MRDLEPLAAAELAEMEVLSGYDLGVHAEEGDQDRLRAMVQEIRAHRSGIGAAWATLTDEQRLDLISRCCHGCGSLDTSCQCWNDE